MADDALRLNRRVTLLLALLLSGCGGGPSREDVNGTWEATLTAASCEQHGGDVRYCGYFLSLGATTRVLTLTQSGAQVTGGEENSRILSGTLTGQALMLEGSEVRGGDQPGSWNERWQLTVDGDRMTGTYTDSSTATVWDGTVATSQRTATVSAKRR